MLISKKDLNQKWVCFEEVPNCNHFTMSLCHPTYVWDLKRFGAGDYIRYYIGEVRNGYVRMFFIENQFDSASQFITQKISQNPQWTKKINLGVEKNAKKLFIVCDRVRKIKFSECSTQQLFKIYKEIEKYLHAEWSLGQVTTYVADAYNQRFSNFVHDKLKRTLEKSNLELNFASVFSLLTTPVSQSWAEKEEKSFFQIASHIANYKDIIHVFRRYPTNKILQKVKDIDKHLYQLIIKHHYIFRWLPYMYEGPTWTIEDFLDNWKNVFVQKEIDIKRHYKEIIHRKVKLRNQQRQIFLKLKPDKKLRYLLHIAQHLVWLKGFRKDGAYYASFVLEKWFQEISKRFGYSIRELRQVYFWEMPKVFKKQLSKRELKERYKHGLLIVTPSKGQAVIGKSVQRIMKKIIKSKEVAPFRELHGTCACPGQAKGKVKIIQVVKDMKKMNKGDILVSQATNPNLVPAMKKASAIITNSGGLTCHAAIVSRELKIPCIIATKIATKVLKDGDRVEVDAERGIIRKL